MSVQEFVPAFFAHKYQGRSLGSYATPLDSSTPDTFKEASLNIRELIGGEADALYDPAFQLSFRQSPGVNVIPLLIADIEHRYLRITLQNAQRVHLRLPVIIA